VLPERENMTLQNRIGLAIRLPEWRARNKEQLATAAGVA